MIKQPQVFLQNFQSLLRTSQKKYPERTRAVHIRKKKKTKNTWLPPEWLNSSNFILSAPSPCPQDSFPLFKRALQCLHRPRLGAPASPRGVWVSAAYASAAALGINRDKHKGLRCCSLTASTSCPSRSSPCICFINLEVKS